MKKFILISFLSLILSIIGGQNAGAQLFYKISGKNLEKPSYLLGTHHLAPLSVADSIKSIAPALDEVRQIVGEIDMTGDQMAMAAAMQPYMIAPQDSTLTEVLSKDDYEKVSAAFLKEVGLPLQMFDSMRPMIPMTLYSVKIMSDLMPGFNPEEQLDSYFQKEGLQRGYKITPLEQLSEQAELLYTSLSVTQQAEELLSCIEDPAKLVESAKELNEKYLSGDLDAMYEVCLKDNAHPEFFDKLTRKRNEKWVEKLPTIMEADPAFIAVGAAHLCGESGLLTALRNLGYTVEPLN